MANTQACGFCTIRAKSRTKNPKVRRVIAAAKTENDILHTTVGIRWWSPTQLLIYRFEAYVWQSERDAQFSSICGRM